MPFIEAPLSWVAICGRWLSKWRPWPFPAGLLIALMGAEAVVITVVTEGLTKPLPFSQRVWALVVAFMFLAGEVWILYRARDREEAHRSLTISQLDSLADRTAELVQAQEALLDASGRPKESLKGRMLALSATLFSLLARKRYKQPFPVMMQTPGMENLTRAILGHTRDQPKRRFLMRKPLSDTLMRTMQPGQSVCTTSIRKRVVTTMTSLALLN